jgi:tRNA nucleotidyltransferase (CCA-adding enzyme)
MAMQDRERSATQEGWQLLPHDADVCVHGWGPTAEVAFEQAAQALTGIVTTESVRCSKEVHVTCQSSDMELLLVEWLNAIIYEMAVQQMLFGRFRVQIEAGQLSGTLWGEAVDRTRHAPACEPKGATYTALSVRHENGCWSAKCVVDV